MIKFDSIQPLLFGGFIQENGNVTIISGYKKIIFKKISDKEKNLLVNILVLCDGINTTRNIISKLFSLGYSTKKATKLLKQLMTQKILVDSREIYFQFHPYLSNITPFHHKLTKEKIKLLVKEIDGFKYDGEYILLQFPKNSDFCKLTSKRRTIREFDKEKMISFQTLSELLYTAYGVAEKTNIDNGKILKRVIPSAGALYPLHIYCIIWGKVENVVPGVYYFNKRRVKGSIIRLRKIPDYNEVIKFMPGSENMVENASLLLVIVCNFKRVTQKYSNRGYMYGLLEAGHVAQNIYLYCAEQNLAAVEIGGFNDIDLSKFLGLKYPKVAPLICFLVGVPYRKT